MKYSVNKIENINEQEKNYMALLIILDTESSIISECKSFPSIKHITEKI